MNPEKDTILDVSVGKSSYIQINYEMLPNRYIKCSDTTIDFNGCNLNLMINDSTNEIILGCKSEVDLSLKVRDNDNILKLKSTQSNILLNPISILENNLNIEVPESVQLLTFNNPIFPFSSSINAHHANPQSSISTKTLNYD